MTRTRVFLTGRWRIGALCLFAFGFAVVALFVAHGQAYAYTNAEIDQKLLGGVGRATSWDSQCYATMINNTFNLHEAARTAINNGGAYGGPMMWVSAQGADKGNTTTITVDYGTKTVNLQLNNMVYICSALVNVGYAQGASYAGTSCFIGTNCGSAVDAYHANAIGAHSPNYPSLTGNGTYIYSASSSGYGGSLSGIGSGTQIQWASTTSSRFWFATPHNFSFTASGSGFTQSGTLTINVTGATINNFNGVYQCGLKSGGAGNVPNQRGGYSKANFDACTTSPSSFSITIKIKPDYTLEPTLSINPSNTVQPGGTIALTPGIKDDGKTSTEDNTTYDVDKFTIKAGGTVPTVTSSNEWGTSTPEAFYKALSGVTATSIVNTTTGAIQYPTPGSVTLTGAWTSQVVPDSAKVGDYMCYAIAIKPATTNTAGGHNSDWRYGTPKCVLVGKAPLVDVLGGDVRADGAVATSTNYDNNTKRNYGSWVEYGLLAGGSIKGMASGAYDAYNDSKLGVATPTAQTPNTDCDFDALTFSNNGCGATLGSYTNAADVQPIAMVTAAFSVAHTLPSSGSLTLGSATVPNDTISGNASSTNTYTLPGNQTLNKGEWYVINVPNANVEIQHNITYNATATLSNLGDIPQLVIIAKNIYIDPGVTNVGSWLYASNSIYTCAVNGTATQNDAATQKLISIATSGTGCGNQLTVHGPVSTAHLYLWRSPDAAQGVPGETFDLRADSYLWAYNQSRESNSISTLGTSEKPPRF